MTKNILLILIFALLFSTSTFGAQYWQQNEVAGFLLKLAPDVRLTKLPDGSAAYGWVRFIEPHDNGCTGYPWCISYWRMCLIGKVTGDPDVIAILTLVSASAPGAVHDVVLPDGRWFKTNAVHPSGDIPQADKDWCLG